MTVRYCRYVRSLPDRAPNPIKGTSSVSWYDVENNPTWQAMRRVGELTRMVIDGKKSMQMICSPPGLGKSEEVLQAAAVAKIELYPHRRPIASRVCALTCGAIVTGCACSTTAILCFRTRSNSMS